MIVPSKHLKFSESLLGFGAYLLGQLNSPKSIDSLWKKYRSDYENEIFFSKHSFDSLVLTILFLSAIGAVDEDNGDIKICS